MFRLYKARFLDSLFRNNYIQCILFIYWYEVLSWFMSLWIEVLNRSKLQFGQSWNFTSLFLCIIRFVRGKQKQTTKNIYLSNYICLKVNGILSAYSWFNTADYQALFVNIRNADMLPVTLVLTHCTCCFLKFKNNLKCSKIFFYNDGLFASKKKCAGCQPRYYLKRKKS